MKRKLFLQSLDRRVFGCALSDLPQYLGAGVKEGDERIDITDELVSDDYSLEDTEQMFFTIENGRAYIVPPEFDGVHEKAPLWVEVSYTAFKTDDPNCAFTSGFPIIAEFTSDDVVEQNPMDLNNDRVIDQSDIDGFFRLYRVFNDGVDFNNDGQITASDVDEVIMSAGGSGRCDLNLDNRFDSNDIIIAFSSGKYETNIDVKWSEGDFNVDGRLLSSDLVYALANCHYE